MTINLTELERLAKAATPGPWKWQGEDYRGGWGWQLLVTADGAGLICGESPDGPYKHLRAYVPIDAQFCKTGMEAKPDSAPCVHVLEPNAKFIAALDSQTVLALIRCARAAKELDIPYNDAFAELRAAVADFEL